MDITAITQLISNVGFPIAVCVYMFWYTNKLNEAHKEEMDSLKDALNSNTVALTEIRTFLQAVTNKD